MSPTPHQSYGRQVFRIVFIRFLILGYKPSKFWLILEYEAAKLRRHIGKPVFVMGSPWIAQVP
jgi:hypothetical protein